MKKIKHIGVFLLFIVGMMMLCCCNSRPRGVLSDDKMVSLMADMELAEAYNNYHTATPQERIDLGKSVLKAHGVTEESLDTTLAWYGRNLDDYARLFDKVDKEISNRRKKYTINPEHKNKEEDNLWPYSRHLVLSSLSGYDALSFSFPRPDVEKGGVINLSFFLPNVTSLKGTFGVEYTDRHGEAVVASFTNQKKVEMALQTDSAREVARIFGIMQLKDQKSMPVYLDSIKIQTEEIDTLNYRSKRRLQKSFQTL